MNTVELDGILKQKLERAFHSQTSKVILSDLQKIASEHSPIDLAYAAPYLPPSIRPILFENLSTQKAKIEFLINTDSSTRTAVFRKISDKETQRLIEEMPADDAVFVLEDLSEKRLRKLFTSLDPKKASHIREIKKHQRNTAGRLMTNEFFSFPPHHTVSQAIQKIRENPGIELSAIVFVTEKGNKLIGYVPTRNLLVNDETIQLKQIMRTTLHHILPETEREKVVDIVERYKLAALPVVNDEGKLQGVITPEDILEAVEDIADETIAQVAGTWEKLREHKPIWRRVGSRAPWLLVTLVAGIVNVGVMASLQSYEEGILSFVLFFVPLITGMSGNIGLQCSTILVRSMAIGSFPSSNRSDIILKEGAIGVVNGALFGIATSSLIWAFDLLGFSSIEISPLFVGTVVGAGLFGSCIAGTLLGVFSPLFFARIGVDPAIASGPIVTAFNDFLSISIYFLIAVGLNSIL